MFSRLFLYFSRTIYKRSNRSTMINSLPGNKPSAWLALSFQVHAGPSVRLARRSSRASIADVSGQSSGPNAQSPAGHGHLAYLAISLPVLHGTVGKGMNRTRRDGRRQKSGLPGGWGSQAMSLSSYAADVSTYIVTICI